MKELPKEERDVYGGGTVVKTAPRSTKRQAKSRPHIKCSLNNRTTSGKTLKPTTNWQKFNEMKKCYLKFVPTGTPKKVRNQQGTASVNSRNARQPATTGKKSVILKGRSLNYASKPTREIHRLNDSSDQIPVLNCIRENQQKQQMYGNTHYIIDQFEDFTDNSMQGGQSSLVGQEGKGKKVNLSFKMAHETIPRDFAIASLLDVPQSTKVSNGFDRQRTYV